MRIYRQVGNIKAALFVGAIILMAGLLLYTQTIIDNLRVESRETVSLYARLIATGVTSASDTELDFLLREVIQKITFPIIQSDADGNPVNWRNLNNGDHLSVEVVRRIMKDMDSQSEPIPLIISVELSEISKPEEIELGHLHYGDSSMIRKLRFLPYVEIGVVAVFIFLGFSGFQVIRRNEKQHIWLGMARETAHQLGTPVSSLMGWLERLRERPEESAEVAKQMAKDIVRLEQISDRFSRMGSAPRLEQVDLKELLQESIDYFKRRIPRTAKDVSLELLADQNIIVRATPTLLSWAIENLIKNAIDSIDKPGGEVNLAFDVSGKEAIITVSDNGRGIPRKDWKNVFRPGYSTKQRGWGVGLSLAKRIIEEFQSGKVRIRSSEVGKGTTFEIRLPRDL